jgi:hypothetical protein
MDSGKSKNISRSKSKTRNNRSNQKNALKEKNRMKEGFMNIPKSLKTINLYKNKSNKIQKKDIISSMNSNKMNIDYRVKSKSPKKQKRTQVNKSKWTMRCVSLISKKMSNQDTPKTGI